MADKVNWKGEFPRERTIMARLGLMGYRSKASVLYIMNLFHYVGTRTDRRFPTFAAFRSRFDKGDARYGNEMRTIREMYPSKVVGWEQEGEEIAATLREMGHKRLAGHLSSPAESAHGSTAKNEAKRKRESYEQSLERVKKLTANDVRKGKGLQERI